MLQSLFLWFYCLPIPSIILLFVLAALVFRRLMLRWRVGSAVLLALWLVVMLQFTILSRTASVSGSAFSWIPFHSYRELLSGGNREILRSNFMNVALFFPAGMLLGGLLPRKWPFGTRLLTIAAVLGAVSFAVELFQSTRLLGLGEIDDVIHNTLGAMLGYLSVSFGTEKLFTPKRRDLP